MFRANTQNTNKVADIRLQRLRKNKKGKQIHLEQLRRLVPGRLGDKEGVSFRHGEGVEESQGVLRLEDLVRGNVAGDDFLEDVVLVVRDWPKGESTGSQDAERRGIGEMGRTFFPSQRDIKPFPFSFKEG